MVAAARSEPCHSAHQRVVDDAVDHGDERRLLAAAKPFTASKRASWRSALVPRSTISRAWATSATQPK